MCIGTFNILVYVYEKGEGLLVYTVCSGLRSVWENALLCYVDIFTLGTCIDMSQYNTSTHVAGCIKLTSTTYQSESLILRSATLMPSV